MLIPSWSLLEFAELARRPCAEAEVRAWSAYYELDPWGAGYLLPLLSSAGLAEGVSVAELGAVLVRGLLWLAAGRRVRGLPLCVSHAELVHWLGVALRPIYPHLLPEVRVRLAVHLRGHWPQEARHAG